MLLLRYLILVIICFNIPQIHASTFYGILVGDTQDSELKKMVRKDLALMSKHLEKISSAISNVEEFKLLTYTRKDLNSTFLKKIEHLEIQPSDIVFFYYSGHGFYMSQQYNEFCASNSLYLYFDKSDVGVPFNEILSIFMMKQPRLTICLIDCCNDPVKKDEIPLKLISRARSSKSSKFRPHPDAIRNLFEKNNGLILGFSAAPGYCAEGTDEEGSDFTRSYVHYFEKIASTPSEVCWENILAKTCSKHFKKQHPYYEILLKSD